MRKNVRPVIALWAAVCFSLSVGTTGATLLVQIGQNFTGSTMGIDSPAQPPDTDGAVGPNHFVEFLNGRFSVYSKADGTRVQTMTDVFFWTSAGVTFASGLDVTDPRVIYDPSSQRWFASQIDMNPSSFRLRANRFLLAVSDSADPTGSWHGFGFAADPGGDFADFPTLGVDANGVYLSGDMYGRNGTSVGPNLVSIPKSDLLSSSPTIANRRNFGIMSYSTRGNILQPAVTTGAATTGESVLGVGDLGYDGAPHATVILSTVLNAAGGTGAALSSQKVLNVSPYVVPSNPAQPDGSSNLDDGDTRFSACVRRVGDILYAVHSLEVGTRAAIRWYRLNAVNNAVLQQGMLTDTDLDLFYPSIAANEAGTVVIGCNGSSATVFVSCYAFVGETMGGVLSFGPIQLLKSGAASYQSSDPSGTSRWGDYSATSVDPADPTHFWTLQAYPSDASTWNTQITEIIALPLRVSLSISPTPSGLMVAWPVSAAGYQLQFTSDLNSGNWQPVPGTPVTSGDQQIVALPATGNQGFYRLVQ